MGVDVVLKARPRGWVVDEDEFHSLVTAFRERFPADEYYSGKDYQTPDIEWDPYEPVQTVSASTLWRYYGEGYERGPWPEIREMGDWLAVALGERWELRYGGDNADEWEYLKPWPDVRRETDAHFEAVGNEPYWSRR